MNIPALQKWLAEPRPALVAAVADGIRAHVGTLRARGVDFYGYAIIPGEVYDISCLGAVTNTETDIKVPPGDAQYRYYRYSVDEWEHYDEGFGLANALLVEANKKFESMHSKPDDDFFMDEHEIAHANVLLDSIMQGMEAAKASGVFGSTEPFLVVWIPDSRAEVMMDSAQRLNSTEVAEEFMREFGS